MKLEPMGEMILIRPITVESETTVGGIVINVIDVNLPVEGTVISIGSEVKTLKIDDVVLYKSDQVINIKDDTEPLVIMGESDVLARVVSC